MSFDSQISALVRHFFEMLGTCDLLTAEGGKVGDGMIHSLESSYYMCFLNHAKSTEGSCYDL